MATVAEKMIETMGKIAEALVELRKTGLPRRVIVLALVEKTKLSEKSIVSVLDAIEATAEEFVAEAVDEVVE